MSATLKSDRMKMDVVGTFRISFNVYVIIKIGINLEFFLSRESVVIII